MNSRSIGLVGAVAISLALVSPTFAVSLNPQAMALEVGAAVPMVFVLAAVPTAAFAIAFYVLTRQLGERGSVFGLVAASVGPRAGTAVGIWLLGAYILAMANYVVVLGILAKSLAAQLDVIAPGTLTAVGIGVLAGGVATVLGVGRIGVVGTLLLILEGISMAVVLVVAGVTAGRLLLDPAGPPVDLSKTLSLSGIPFHAVALALSFAVLAIAGFEASAATADATRNPQRNIPLALVTTAGLALVFYAVVSFIGVWAFGTDAEGVSAFSSVESLPAAMADRYVSEGVGTYLVLGAGLSAFAAMISIVIAGGHILAVYAQAGVLPRAVSGVSAQGTPMRASVLTAALALPPLAAWFVLGNADLPNIFASIGVAAGLLFMAVYAVVSLGAARLAHRGGHLLTAVACVAGFLISAAVIALSTWPLPTGIIGYGPLAAMAVIVLGSLVAWWRGESSGRFVVAEASAHSAS